MRDSWCWLKRRYCAGFCCRIWWALVSLKDETCQLEETAEQIRGNLFIHYLLSRYSFQKYIALVLFNYQASFQYVPLTGNSVFLKLQQLLCLCSYGWESEAECDDHLNPH